ncbi:MAG: multiheme c-type cytochrome, partial [Planctomycetota bacterium]
MKITRRRVLAVVGFVASGLLVLAASCAFEGRTSGEAAFESEDGQVDESTTGTPAAGKEVAEKTFTANEFCAACHYAFGEEELAANHEKAGIGCERCHGESERHRSDEDNITPPEIMYPKNKIMPTCMMCHPRHEIEQVG